MIKEGKNMKKVGMFVWNHFTNDARVLRECTALSENGYDVELICIDDPNDPTIATYEEVNEHFKVFRMKRYPTTLLVLQGLYRFISEKKWPLLPLLSLWVLFIYIHPFMTIVLTVVFGIIFSLLLKTKVRVIWIRAALILRMIIKGYKGNYDIYHSNDLNTLPQGYVCAKWRFKR